MYLQGGLGPHVRQNSSSDHKIAYTIYIYIYTKASIRIMLKLRGSTFLHSYIAAITMSS